jgi:hypothetical protein
LHRYSKRDPNPTLERHGHDLGWCGIDHNWIMPIMDTKWDQNSSKRVLFTQGKFVVEEICIPVLLV